MRPVSTAAHRRSATGRGRRSWAALGVVAALSLTASQLGTQAGAAAGSSPSVLPSGCTQSGAQVTCTYSFTDGEQTFAVPAGVTSVQVTAVGAAGGRNGNALPGGQGAQVTGTVSGLTGGKQLYVEVGGTPTSGSTCNFNAQCVGGFNGGGTVQYSGGGGGASDLRTISSTQPGSLHSRLIVAGAGGGSGGGGYPCDTDGAAGGAAGAPGNSSTCGDVSTTGGGPGTQTAGGAAGTPDFYGKVEPGVLGAGGSAWSGGGGGGGLYGGGGGGDVHDADFDYRWSAGGGGGGGSSLVPAGGTEALSSAPASLTITYLACQQFYTGSVSHGIVAASGTTCISSATVGGSVTVTRGATLIVDNSTVRGSIVANAPAGITICGSVTSTISVGAAAGPVTIGDPANDCAPNTVRGNVVAVNNHGGGTIIGNTISGRILTVFNRPAFTVSGNHH